MNIFFDKINIALVITAAINFILGAIILLRGRNRMVRMIYTFNVIALIAWVMAMVFYRSSSPENSLLSCLFLYIAPTFVASTFLYFTYIFPFSDKPSRTKTITIFAINLILIILVAIPGVIIKEVNVRPGLEKEIIFSRLYVFYFLYIFGYFMFGFFRLFKKYFRTTKKERSQIAYFLIGYCLTATPSFITNLTMPWLGHFYLNWLGQIFTLTLVACTTYSIIIHRFAGIHVIFGKLYINIALAIYSYFFFYFFLNIHNNFLNGPTSKLAILIGIPFAVLFSYVFIKFFDFIKRTSEKLFYRGDNPQRIKKDLIIQLGKIVDIQQLNQVLQEELNRLLHTDKLTIALFLENKEADDEHNINWKTLRMLNPFAFPELISSKYIEELYNLLYKTFVKNPIIIVKEEIGNLNLKQPFLLRIAHLINTTEIDIIAPLLNRNKIVGFIFLGEKPNHQAYTKEEIEFIEDISPQLASVFTNAYLYDNMENLVKIQTEELKQKSLYMEELLAMKTDFLRVVNHQLNTPLSIMKNAFALIKDQTISSDDGLKYIKSGLQRIDDTVNDFWHAFALEGERLKMRPEITTIQKVIESLVEEKKSMTMVQNRNLKIEILEPNKNLPEVFCDAKQISHALSNILDNAIFYTLEGGVRVSFLVISSFDKITENKKYVKILIEDSGIGINQKDQEKLFKKFSRGIKSTNYHVNGSGLGLYIARKIIEANNGEIILEKTEVNHGSTFSVILPIYDPSLPISVKNKTWHHSSFPDVERQTKSANKIPENPKNILLVEDEQFLADTYILYLKRQGFNVELAGETEQAWKKIQNEKIDVILLDIVIPQNTNDDFIYTVAEQGWDLLEKIKNNSTTKNIPVIILTNLNTEQDRERAKKMGANDYLFKGTTTPEILIEKIKNIFK